MNFKFYECVNAVYSDTSFNADVRYRILYHPTKGTLEVIYELIPEVRGHSGNRFNMMLMDRDESLPDDDRKYFTKIGWLDKQRIIWMYGNNILQQPKTWYRLIDISLGFGSGYFLHYITHLA